MRSWNVRAAILILPALALGAATSSLAGADAKGSRVENPKSQEQTIDPQAKDALTRMSEFVRSLSMYSLHEEISREQVINGDLKVQKTATADVLVKTPDRMKAVMIGDDGKNRALLFDGKTFTAFFPDQNYYAQAEAPGPTAAALEMAEQKYGIELPTADFLRMTSTDEYLKELKAAGFVGKSKVNGADAEHYAYRTDEIDYQLWIATGDKPLPLKLLITSKKQPSQPEYTAVMTWNLEPKIDDASFAFTPPQGAMKIPFGMPASMAPKRQGNNPAPQTQPQK